MRPAVCLILLSILASAAPLRAAPMEHHDLASLLFEAEHVVEAQAVSHQHLIEEWNTTTTYRVTRVLQGDLALDSEIQVFDDAYNYDIRPRYDWTDPAAPRALPVPELDPQVFLFLAPAPPRQINEQQATPEGLFHKVPSGMRIVAEGHVYRFEQMMNPGPYGPVPQGPDPEDIFVGSLELDPDPLTVAEFLVELEQAARRAAECRAALAIGDAGQRNAALLALLPPPMEFPPGEVAVSWGFQADDLSRHIQQEIGRSGDLEAFVEAYGRAVPASFGSYVGRNVLQPDPDGRRDRLREMALDTGRPTLQRYTALRILAEGGILTEKERPRWLAAMAPLLDDPDWVIRVAAVPFVGSRLFVALEPEVRDTLAAGLAREQHPEVLISYAGYFRGQGLKKAMLDPLLTGERTVLLAPRLGPGESSSAGELVLGYQYVIPYHEWSPRLTLTAVVSGPDETRYRSVETRFVRASHGQDGGGGLARFRFDPPLPGDDVVVYLEAVVDPDRDQLPAMRGESLYVAVPIIRP